MGNHNPNWRAFVNLSRNNGFKLSKPIDQRMPIGNVLALSSSRKGNEGYLESASLIIDKFLGSSSLEIAFIPFASVDRNYQRYIDEVTQALTHLPHKLTLVTTSNAKNIIGQCDAIMAGGGNTFKLLHDIYEAGILELLKQKINNGTPFIGWSAGANIASPTIATTNDMPIIQPESFNALELFSFQINPHYHNYRPAGFNGETRDQRLIEFIRLNPKSKVIGLPEGTALEFKSSVLTYIGSQAATLFSAGGGQSRVITTEINAGDDLSFLLR